MSLKSAPYYWIECDGCGAKSTEDGEFSAWGDQGSAYDDAHNNAEWITIDAGVEMAGDYCQSCAPFPMCAGCGENTARTEHDGETWCDECIVEEAEETT